MNRKLLAVMLVLLVAPFDVVMAQGSAQATCMFAGPEAPCALSWDFTLSSRAYYRVQRLDTATGSWRNMEQVAQDTSPQGTRVVEGGHLYRVLACDDAVSTSSCVSSTLHWAPLLVKGDSDIPESVAFTDADGSLRAFTVDKRGGLLEQLAQYNVYEFEKSIARANARELPDMTPPPSDVGVSGSLENQVAIVHLNVYAAYQGKRGNPVPENTEGMESPKLYEYHLPEPHD